MGSYIKGKGSGPNYTLHPSLVGTMASWHRVDDCLWLSLSGLLKSIVSATIGRDSVAVKIDRQTAADIWLFIGQMELSYANRRADSRCVKIS